MFNHQMKDHIVAKLLMRVGVQFAVHGWKLTVSRIIYVLNVLHVKMRFQVKFSFLKLLIYTVILNQGHTGLCLVS